MKKILLWFLMVIAFTALIVGGTIGWFWLRAGVSSLPAAEFSFGGKAVEETVGYDWKVPVFWGARERAFAQSPSLSVTKLGTIEENHPDFVLPDWVTEEEITVKDSGGKTVFSGSCKQYRDYVYEDNGQYTVSVKLSHLIENERPAVPQGSFYYTLRFTLSAKPGISFSKTSVSQGSVIGIKVLGTLGTTPPQAQCDLGSVWFSYENGSWLGYLPVAFNAEAGKHAFTLTAGSQKLETELEVYQKEFARVTVEEEEEQDVPAGAGTQYRNEIWPLYDEGSLPKQWLGGFTQPVKGNLVQDYGVYLVGTDGTSRSCDLTLQVPAPTQVVMPTDGTIAYAGELLLCGKTVVIDHGCGLKTYISGLNEIYVHKGQSLLQGEAVGMTGEENIIIEMRIGNKSIYPWDAWRGNGGLFYR